MARFKGGPGQGTGSQTYLTITFTFSSGRTASSSSDFKPHPAQRPQPGSNALPKLTSNFGQISPDFCKPQDHPGLPPNENEYFFKFLVLNIAANRND